MARKQRKNSTASPAQIGSIDGTQANKYASVSTTNAYLAQNMEQVDAKDVEKSQLILKFKGKAEEKEANRVYLQGVMNEAVGDYGTYTISAKGLVTYVATKDMKLEEASPEIQAFVNTMQKIIGGAETTTVAVETSAGYAQPGEYDAEVLDIDNLKVFDQIDNETKQRDAFSTKGKLIHELFEQYNKQVVNADVKGDDYKGDDAAAVTVENLVNNTVRDGTVSHVLDMPKTGISFYYIDVEVDGTMVTVEYKVEPIEAYDFNNPPKGQIEREITEVKQIPLKVFPKKK